MSVYVDVPRWKLGRMVMCHMIADSLDELHEMATKLGLKRDWFQDRASTPHYDVCKRKRVQAVRLGAIACDRRAFVGHVRRIRAEGG